MILVYVSQAAIHDVEYEEKQKNDDQNDDKNDDEDDTAVESIMKTHSPRTDPVSLTISKVNFLTLSYLTVLPSITRLGSQAPATARWTS